MPKLGDCFPGNWLKSSDLGDDDHVVTIKDVRQEMVGQGKDQQLKLVMEFEELARGLILNKTNATTISKVLDSDNTDDWIGQRVILWVNPEVQFAGDLVSAIRVRNKKPAAVVAHNNGPLSYQDAVKLCANNGINEGALKDHLKACGLTKWNPGLCTPVVLKFIAALEPPPNDDDQDVPF
jgi:hypothetical protein